MNEFNEIYLLLQEKADYQARINMIPYLESIQMTFIKFLFEIQKS